MRTPFVLLVMVLLCAFTRDWETDFTLARTKARQERKYILLNFSGSDWCGPCIRMKHELFDAPAFIAFADTSLILVNADFPRQKKNHLPRALQEQNDQLAEKYNPTGSFPYTVLLDENGKTIKTWDGFPKEGPEAFINEINQDVNGKH